MNTSEPSEAFFNHYYKLLSFYFPFKFIFWYVSIPVLTLILNMLFNHDAIFNSIQSYPETTVSPSMIQGYAICCLVNSMQLILKRTKKISIGHWKNRVKKELGIPSYYNYIESTSQLEYKKILIQLFSVISKNRISNLMASFLFIKKRFHDRKISSMQAGYYLLARIAIQARRMAFNKIQKYTFIKTVRNRHVKERILWAKMVLKNSKSLGIKKCFKKWSKWTMDTIKYSKTNVHVKINKYRVKNM